MLELRANRKFGDFTLLKFFRFGEARAARAPRLFSFVRPIKFLMNFEHSLGHCLPLIYEKWKG